MFFKGNTVESINFGGLNARLEGFCSVNFQRNPNLETLMFFCNAVRLQWPAVLGKLLPK